MTEQREKPKYVYIYNPIQSNFYINKGVMIKETGIHPVTKKTWYKFDYDESYDAYSEWCTRNKNK